MGHALVMSKAVWMALQYGRTLQLLDCYYTLQSIAGRVDQPTCELIGQQHRQHKDGNCVAGVLVFHSLEVQDWTFRPATIANLMSCYATKASSAFSK